MKKFKVLVYGNGMFVDENLLSKGVYLTSIPSLHLEDTTMESYIESIKSLEEAWGNIFNVDIIIENLKDCEFITYKLERECIK